MDEPIRVLLADDHALFRRGLAQLLAESAEVDVVGEAEDGHQAVEMAEQLQPHVVLMDVHMPRSGGVEAVRTLKQGSAIKVLMLTVSDQDEDLLGAIDAGADGYLLKNAEPSELMRAIRHVAAGRGALSPEVTARVMERAAGSKRLPPPQQLTPREEEVLALLAEGQTTAQIAQSLVISASTVKTHVNHILRKLKASNRTEAVAKAVSGGLLGEGS